MRFRKLMPLLLVPFATGCVGMLGSDRICPIKPVYTEEEIEFWSDEHVEYVFAVELQGEQMGCWDLEE